MEKIVIVIKPSDVKVRNEFHFNTQLKTRMNIFQDKKRMSKNGYRKHKGSF